jgi:hypothetical protein
VKRIVLFFCILFAAELYVAAGQPEDLEIFRASRRGDDVWAWSKGRAAWRSRRLVVSENNHGGGYGDVYTADRYPYFRGGIVEVDVDEVLAGQYVVQAMCFKAGQYIDSVTLLHSSTNTGRFTVKLSDLYVPSGTEEIGFKVWVEKAEGASTAFSELFYHVAIDQQQLTFNETFEREGRWETQHLDMRIGGGRAVLVLDEGERLGAVLSEGRWPIRQVGRLLFSVMMVDKGDVSVQAVVFDGDGKYVESVSLLENIGTGFHARGLENVSWPRDADTMLLKIWLSGMDAGAVFDRVMLTRRESAQVSMSSY